jgi:hypothetical protein
MRAMLLDLKDLVDTSAVLGMHGATRTEVELLAAVERELKSRKGDATGW